MWFFARDPSGVSYSDGLAPLSVGPLRSLPEPAHPLISTSLARTPGTGASIATRHYSGGKHTTSTLTHSIDCHDFCPHYLKSPSINDVPPLALESSETDKCVCCVQYKI